MIQDQVRRGGVSKGWPANWGCILARWRARSNGVAPPNPCGRTGSKLAPYQPYLDP